MTEEDSEKMKSARIELSLHFEKEAVMKKKISEIDNASESLAFDLFAKQLKVTKLKNRLNG